MKYWLSVDGFYIYFKIQDNLDLNIFEEEVEKEEKNTDLLFILFNSNYFG